MNLKLKFRSKFNHDFTNDGYLQSAVWKVIYNFKIKRAKEARHNQFLFQNVQNNEIFEIWKMFKNNSWINVYYTKSKRLQSLNCLFYFDWKYHFRVNLVQKIKIVTLSGNLVPRLIWICENQWWCSLLQFLTGNTFLGKFDPKNQNYHLKRKFFTKTNLNMRNSMMMFTFSVFDQKYLFPQSWS